MTPPRARTPKSGKSLDRRGARRKQPSSDRSPDQSPKSPKSPDSSTALVPASSSASSPQQAPLSEHDLDALSRFCDSIQIDDVSLERWDACHADLDLTVPLFLGGDDAARGGEHSVKLSRTTTLTAAKGASQSSRALAACSVTVPAGARDGDIVTVAGAGDVRDAARGDLKVIIRIRARS